MSTKRAVVAVTGECVSFSEIHRAYQRSGGNQVLWRLVLRATGGKDGMYPKQRIRPDEMVLLQEWSDSS